MKRKLTILVIALMALAFAAPVAQADVSTNVRNSLVRVEHLPNIHATLLLGASGNQWSGAWCGKFYYNASGTIGAPRFSTPHEWDAYGGYSNSGNSISFAHVAYGSACDPSIFDQVGPF